MSRDEKCVVFGRQFAARMFADMVNPINRGPNFQWSGFVALVERFAQSQLFLSVDFSVTPRHEQLAKDSARLEAELLLNSSGLNDVQD